ncbi:MAG: type IV pilin protein [Gemmatimonadota bacterium]
MPATQPLGHPARVASTRGFSLIELLVVVSFMAILVALAVPRFHTVTSKAFDAAAKSDLRNALEAEEQYYAQFGRYEEFSLAPGGSSESPPFKASIGVSVTASVDDAVIQIVTQHQSSEKVWCVSSVSGGIVLGDDC